VLSGHATLPQLQIYLDEVDQGYRELPEPGSGLPPPRTTSLTPCVERRELAAAHCHELRPQPAMAIDPGADFMRIEPHYQLSAARVGTSEREPSS
jgi:hypothetical protein